VNLVPPRCEVLVLATELQYFDTVLGFVEVFFLSYSSLQNDIGHLMFIGPCIIVIVEE